MCNVNECPAALLSLSGATIYTSWFSDSASAKALIPFDAIPSSFDTNIFIKFPLFLMI